MYWMREVPFYTEKTGQVFDHDNGGTVLSLNGRKKSRHSSMGSVGTCLCSWKASRVNLWLVHREHTAPCRGSGCRRTWLILFPLSQTTYTLCDGGLRCEKGLDKNPFIHHCVVDQTMKEAPGRKIQFFFLLKRISALCSTATLNHGSYCNTYKYKWVCISSDSDHSGYRRLTRMMVMCCSWTSRLCESTVLGEFWELTQTFLVNLFSTSELFVSINGQKGEAKGEKDVPYVVKCIMRWLVLMIYIHSIQFNFTLF